MPATDRSGKRIVRKKAGPPTPVKAGPPTPKYVRPVARSGPPTPKPKAGPPTPKRVAKINRLVREGKLNDVSGGRGSSKTASIQAPVLKVLEQTTRPLHALAGAEKAAIEGIKRGSLDVNAIGKAASRGIRNKDKTTMSDVIKATGYKGPGAGTVGFALDVAGDPLTYVTGGAGSIAAKTAVKASKRTAVAVEKAAAKAAPKAARVVTKKEASRAVTRGPDAMPSLAERAHARALRTGDQRKGIVVKFAGREVPGVRTVTAKIPKPKVAKTRVGKAVRSVAADVNPDIAPVGVAKAVSDKTIAATRTARAHANVGLREAQQRAIGIHSKIGEKNYVQVIDALEAGSVKSLPAELQDAARQIAAHFKYIRRQERRAGILTPNHANYVPHAPIKYLKGGEGIVEPPAAVTIGAAGRKKVTLGATKGRVRRAPLATLRDTHPGEYSHDLPLLYANRMASGSTAVARANLLSKIADTGERLKLGDKAPDFKALESEGRGVYQLVSTKEGFHLKPVKDAHALAAVNSGRVVVLSHDVVKRATEGVTPSLKGGGIVAGLDKAQVAFKRIAIATPGFHVRNIVGDTQNAYLGQAGHRLPGNIIRSGRVLKAASRQDRALRRLEPAKAGKGTVKTGHYGTVTYDEVARNLAQTGGYRTGYTAKEIPELATSGEKAGIKPAGKVRRAGRKVTKPLRPLGRAIKQTALNREDLPRVATAVEALRNGATWEQAASKVADLHFDYQHLTSFERNVARRAMPFYCMPDDHEILTRRGFKRHDDVTVGEDVLSLNHETGDLEWTPLLDVATFAYDGPLRTIKRRGADFAFTPDHRWPVVTCRSFVKDKWYGGKRIIKRAHDLNPSDRIPLTGDYRVVESSLTPRHAAILGWLVGDGYFRWRGNHCEMVVYQSPKKHLVEVGELLGTRPRAPHPDTSVVCTPVALSDVRVLIAAGFRTKEDLLEIVSRLSREAAEAMWDALFKAEGFTDSRTGQQGLTQVAGPVLEAFQLLCLLTGRTCNIGAARRTGGWNRQPVSAAYVRKSSHIMVGRMGEEHYSGTIWCPRTKHGTWVVRHNGTVAMTGNTWSARNIPLQARKVVTRPGKYANYQKLREEAAKATQVEQQDQQTRDMYARLRQAGVEMPEGWAQYLSEWEQRNAGVPVHWKGHTFTISLGLPLQDLSELPGAAGKRQLGEYFQKAMSLATPIVKDPVEYFNNHSFFFRDQIERDHSPNVAAPSYVGLLGDKIRKDLHVVKIVDKRSGKMVWAWPGKMDYLVKAIPGTPSFAQQLLTGSDRRGKGTGGKVLSFVGVKAVPFDPTSAAVNLAYARMQELQKQLSGLNQQGFNKDHPNPEWRKASDQLKIVTQIAYQGKSIRGDAVLPTAGGPSKKRVARKKAAPSGGFLGGGGSSSPAGSSGGFLG